MSEQPARVAVKSAAVHHLNNRLIPAAKIAVLLVSIAAAVPTAKNIYYSWVNGIPFAEVPHRLAQYDLWMKNLGCKVAYRALLTANGNKLDAGACAKTGDIAIKITGTDGQATYEWIAFDQLGKPAKQSAGLTGLLIAGANAAVLPQPGISKAPNAIQRAQAGMEVLCEARQGKRVIRVIKDGDKCFREIVLPMRGSLERREEVACNTPCG